MHRRGPFLLAVVIAAVIGLPAVVSVLQAQDDGRALPEKDWPLVGGDWMSARYSTLRQIDTQNVRKLGGAGAAHLAGAA
jgi:glucose dehydrogenase